MAGHVEVLSTLAACAEPVAFAMDAASSGRCHIVDIRLKIAAPGGSSRLVVKKAIYFEGIFSGVADSKVLIEVNRKLKETIYGEMLHGIRLASAGADEPDVYIRTEVTFAIKTFFRLRIQEYLDKKHQENPKQELGALMYLSARGGHPNIVGQVAWGSNNDQVFSFLEFCDGSELYDLVSSQGAFDEDVCRFVFRQICTGLKHLHSHGIGHRDLTLENVMINNKGLCKIIDLGMCLKCETVDLPGVGRVVMPTPKRPVCGKKLYYAPEVIKQTEIFNPLLVDIWNLGIMLFILLAGVPPFSIAHATDQRFRLVVSSQEGLIALLAHWQITMSPGAIDLISRILKENPNERLALDAILAHPWMNERDTSEYPAETVEFIASIPAAPGVIHRPLPPS